MQGTMQDQFIDAAQRFRKVDACVLSDGQLHFGEMVVMETISTQCDTECAALNVPEITKRLHISKPAVSQILNSLERKGCITRQISPGDRRRILVQATSKGKEYWNHSRNGYDQFMSAMTERFGQQDMDQLIQLMDRFNDVYEQIIDEKRRNEQ